MQMGESLFLHSEFRLLSIAFGTFLFFVLVRQGPECLQFSRFTFCLPLGLIAVGHLLVCHAWRFVQSCYASIRSRLDVCAFG